LTDLGPSPWTPPKNECGESKIRGAFGCGVRSIFGGNTGCDQVRKGAKLHFPLKTSRGGGRRKEKEDWRRYGLESMKLHQRPGGTKIKEEKRSKRDDTTS